MERGRGCLLEEKKKKRKEEEEEEEEVYGEKAPKGTKEILVLIGPKQI